MPIDSRSPGSEPPPRPPRRTNAARLFGYDMFVSFALGPPPRGTQSYASDLARRLRERDFTVFFSEDEAAPGSPLTSTLRNALYRSRVLVVIANRGTLAEPRWVRTEIEEFRARHPARPIIPISIDGALQDPAIAAATDAWLGHGQNIWLDETARAVEQGIASDALVERLALAPGQVRSNVRWRRVVACVIAGLIALTATSVAAAVYAVRQRDEANRQNIIAQAGRLAAQADLLRERSTQRPATLDVPNAIDASALLAGEAVRGLHRAGERALEADLSLRRALALLPQVVERLDSEGDQLALSSDARYVTFTREAGGEVTVRPLNGGPANGCTRSDLQREQVTESKALRLVTAASSTGAWCVVQQFDAANQQTIEIWSGQPAKRLDQFAVDSRDGHVSLAIDDRGALVAITDRSQLLDLAKSTLRIWDRARRSMVLTLRGEEFRGFSPDGRHFATTRGLYALPAAGAPATMRLTWAAPPWHLAFSPDGQYLATRLSRDGEVEIWEPATPRAVASTSPPSGAVLAIDRDARFLIVEENGITRLWDIRTDRVRGSVPFEGKAAAFASDRAVLLIEQLDELSIPHLVHLAMHGWGSAIAGLEMGQGEPVRWLDIRDDQAYLLVEAKDAMRLDAWRPGEQGMRTLISIGGGGPWAASADGSHLAISHATSVSVLGVHDAKVVADVPQREPPALLALSADGTFLATTAAGRVEVSRPGTSDRWPSPALAGEPVGIKISTDGRYALAIINSGEASRAGSPYSLLRWRVGTSEPWLSLDLGRTLDPPTPCAIADDGLFLETPGGRVPIAPDTRVAALVQVPDDECLAPAGRPFRLQLQNGGDDGAMLVVERETARAVARLEHDARIAMGAVSVDGSDVLTVDEKGVLRLFALEPTVLVKQICDRGPSELSAAQWAQYLGPAVRVDVCGRARPEPVSVTP